MRVRAFVTSFAGGLAVLAASPALAAPAAPEPQRAVYDLSVDGSPVGSREVTVTFLSRPSGERHVIDAHTVLDVAGVHLESRVSGLSTPSGAQFSAATERGGARSAVSGQELPAGGWRVTFADGHTESERAEAAVRLSTVDLMDPGRVALLDAPGPFAVLIAETGDVVSGTLSAGEPGTLTVHGRKVSVTRYTLSGEHGSARFFVADGGVLVRSDVTWLGVTVQAAVQDLPAPRDFGAVESIDGLGAGVKEGDL